MKYTKAKGDIHTFDSGADYHLNVEEQGQHVAVFLDSNSEPLRERLESMDVVTWYTKKELATVIKMLVNIHGRMDDK